MLTAADSRRYGSPAQHINAITSSLQQNRFYGMKCFLKLNVSGFRNLRLLDANVGLGDKKLSVFPGHPDTLIT